MVLEVVTVGSCRVEWCREGGGRAALVYGRVYITGRVRVKQAGRRTEDGEMMLGPSSGGYAEACCK
jgi:hypothetical protein